MKTVMVIGAGQMGSGIAQVIAQAGYSVLLTDVTEEAVRKGIAGIESGLRRDMEKGRKTERDKENILSHIQYSAFEGARDCDLLIEAASENIAVKKDIFTKLAGICPPDTIFATNTSSLPITELAAFTRHPDHFIGMHFMNPVPVMKLVELIRGLYTSNDVYNRVRDLCVKIEKTPVEVNDAPGFAVNRVLMPMINEAVFCVYEGVATVQAVDTVMKLGTNHPMGPLALADLIGLDTCLSIMEVLYDGFKDSKYRPCPLLRKYVKAGRLGKKSGKGFYEY
jgi:3-hydroxybutyryl-CoA dehydrogenase